MIAWVQVWKFSIIIKSLRFVFVFCCNFIPISIFKKKYSVFSQTQRDQPQSQTVHTPSVLGYSTLFEVPSSPILTLRKTVQTTWQNLKPGDSEDGRMTNDSHKSFLVGGKTILSPPECTGPEAVYDTDLYLAE